MLLVILHAPDEDGIAEQLVQPIKDAGYDVWNTAEVLVGDHPVKELSDRLTMGGPVVICGTRRAVGSKWVGQILAHVDNPAGKGRTRVFPVRMESDANLESLTWSTKIAECAPHFAEGISELVRSLKTYYPLSPQDAIDVDEVVGSASQIGDFDSWLTHRSDYSSEALNAFLEVLGVGIRESGTSDSLDGRTFLTASNLMLRGRLYATGVLLFSDHPESLIPSAYVQCVRYCGSDQTAGQQGQEYYGPLLKQIQGAMAFIENHTDSIEVIDPDTKAARTDYRFPMVCIREILANALCHRDYLDWKRHSHVRIFEDRIEVVSPGTWVSRPIRDGHLYDLAQLRSEPASPNERLATALRRVKMVETQGSGIPSAVRDCEERKAPPPTVISQDSAPDHRTGRVWPMVKVTVFPSSDWSAVASSVDV